MAQIYHLDTVLSFMMIYPWSLGGAPRLKRVIRFKARLILMSQNAVSFTVKCAISFWLNDDAALVIDTCARNAPGSAGIMDVKGFSVGTAVYPMMVTIVSSIVFLNVDLCGTWWKLSPFSARFVRGGPRDSYLLMAGLMGALIVHHSRSFVWSLGLDWPFVLT